MFIYLHSVPIAKSVNARNTPICAGFGLLIPWTHQLISYIYIYYVGLVCD